MANKRLLIVLQEKQLKENNSIDQMMEGMPMDMPPMEPPAEQPNPTETPEPVVEDKEIQTEPIQEPQPHETGTMADILEPLMEETPDESEYEYVDANLAEGEYPNTYADHEITPDELNKAIDVIISAFYQQKQNSMTVDLDEKEVENGMEEREMSLDEIEQALGCKVKIINKVEWSDYGV